LRCPPPPGAPSLKFLCRLLEEPEDSDEEREIPSFNGVFVSLSFSHPVPLGDHRAPSARLGLGSASTK